MMNIKDRIEKLKGVFVSFNITEGFTYALTKIPSKWVIPDTIEQFQVSTTYDKSTGGYYFVTKVDDGVENVFDAIDYVVKLNKSIEEKKQLLQEKANELSELFASEPIERLRTLEFVFKPQKKQLRKGKKNKKTEEVPVSEPIVRETTGNVQEETPVREEVVPTEQTVDNNCSLIDIAQELIEGEEK